MKTLEEALVEEFFGTLPKLKPKPIKPKGDEPRCWSCGNLGLTSFRDLRGVWGRLCKNCLTVIR